MDRQNEEFESFLKQFQLRSPGPLPEVFPARDRQPQRSRGRWLMAAAAVIALLVSSALIRNFVTVHGPSATVDMAGNNSLYKVGQKIEAGDVIRSNDATGLVVALEDGSKIEMRSQSSLALESAPDGVRVRLQNGSIIVSAAKQGAGHLYVQTSDAMVSVVGTLFLVSAEQSGTRVAVVEGEVHVQQGPETKKLLPGEQIATKASMAQQSVAEEIAWSRSARAYVVVLERTTGEVVSVEPAPSSPRVVQQQQPSSPNGPLEPRLLAMQIQQAANAFQNAIREMQTQRLQDIQNQQKQLATETQKLADNPNDPQRKQTAQALRQRQEALADKLRMSEMSLQGAARNVLNPQVANAARTAANELATNRTGDRMQQAADSMEVQPASSLQREQEVVTQLGDTIKRLNQVAAALSSTAVAAALPTPQAPQAPPVQTPTPPADNPGKKLMERVCGGCHSPEVATTKHFLTKAEYGELVNSQQAMGAKIAADEIQPLVDYLYDNFHSQSEPPLNTPR